MTASRLATYHFVDFSGKMSVDEIAHLLEVCRLTSFCSHLMLHLVQVRAKRKEMEYETYEFDYLPNLKANAVDLVQDV